MRQKLILALFGVLVVVAAVLAVQPFSPPSGVGVEPRESDDRLQREDEVIVRNASADFADDLRLIVHRVDDLRGGDDVRHRIVLEVGAIREEDAPGVTNREGFVTFDSAMIRFLGANPGQSDPPTALALLSNQPGTRNVTIQLPTVSRVRSIEGVSYQSLLAHELGGIPLRTVQSDSGASRSVTADFILAQRAVGEGVANTVSERYVQRYNGNVDMSKYRPDADDPWKERVLTSVYFEGYQYADARDLTRVPRSGRLNTTAELLHPNLTLSISEPPAEPFDQSFRETYDRVASDRVGELAIRELLVARGLSTDRARRAAAGWRNGRLARYTGDGRLITAWTTAWADEDERAAFVTAYDEAIGLEVVERFENVTCDGETRYAIVRGDRVTIVRCS